MNNRQPGYVIEGRQSGRAARSSIELANIFRHRARASTHQAGRIESRRARFCGTARFEPDFYQFENRFPSPL